MTGILSKGRNSCSRINAGEISRLNVEDKPKYRVPVR